MANMFDNNSKIKTHKEYLDSLSKEHKEVTEKIYKEIKKAIPNEDEVVISGIVGFKSMHYKYPSGREGDWFTIGLAARKTGYCIYICCLNPKNQKYLVEEHAKEIGKAICGKSCIRFKKLEDINFPFVLTLIKKAVENPVFGI